MKRRGGFLYKDYHWIFGQEPEKYRMIIPFV
jgi:hypothetical protein